MNPEIQKIINRYGLVDGKTYYAFIQRGGTVSAANNIYEMSMGRAASYAFWNEMKIVEGGGKLFFEEAKKAAQA